jgi:hypothetical protein
MFLFERLGHEAVLIPEPLQREARDEGLEAAVALARLYAAMRLFVNFFPALVQAGRDGA